MDKTYQVKLEVFVTLPAADEEAAKRVALEFCNDRLDQYTLADYNDAKTTDGQVVTNIHSCKVVCGYCGGDNHPEEKCPNHK